MEQTTPMTQESTTQIKPEGSPVASASQTETAASTNASRALAVTSLILGVIAIMGCWLPLVNWLSAVLALIGLIVGIMALVKRQGGLALAGVIVSLVTLALVIVMNNVLGNIIKEGLKEEASIPGLDIIGPVIAESSDSAAVVGRVVNNTNGSSSTPQVVFRISTTTKEEGECSDFMLGSLEVGEAWDFHADCVYTGTPKDIVSQTATILSRLPAADPEPIEVQ